MYFITLLKELLNYREVLDAFLFVLILLSIIFKEVKTLVKVLRKALGIYLNITIIIKVYFK